MPQGYAGGTFSSTTTWASSTFNSLGVTPGTYTWTWGSGPTADSMTLNITAIPEPAHAAFILLGGLGLAVLRRGLRRANAR